MNERIIELEKRVAHQENLLSELNEVVIDQHKEIQKLKQNLSQLKEKMESADFVVDPKDEPPPPHY